MYATSKKSFRVFVLNFELNENRENSLKFNKQISFEEKRQHVTSKIDIWRRGRGRGNVWKV